jgi:hypothetical protein
MEPTDLTIEILKGIREELRGTNARIDGTNERLDRGIDESNQRFGHLERTQTETEVRLATELAAVTGAVHEVRDLLREDRQLKQRVDDHERRLAAVEARVG